MSDQFDPRVSFFVAYYHDWSRMAVFGTELECLRYAVEKSMSVMRVMAGEDLREIANSGRGLK